MGLVGNGACEIEFRSWYWRREGIGSGTCVGKIPARAFAFAGGFRVQYTRIVVHLYSAFRGITVCVSAVPAPCSDHDLAICRASFLFFYARSETPPPPLVFPPTESSKDAFAKTKPRPCVARQIPSGNALRLVATYAVTPNVTCSGHKSRVIRAPGHP